MYTKIFILVSLLPIWAYAYTFSSETELATFLHTPYEANASATCTKAVIAEWNYDTDVDNSEKADIVVQVTLETADVEKAYWEEYFKDLKAEDYQEERVKREVASLKNLGDSALEPQKLETLTTTVNSMTNIYSTAKICPYTNQGCDLATQGLSLEPGIEEVISTSTDYDELEYVWTAWRNASGSKMKDLYKTYVTLSNEAAVANGFDDKGAMWRDRFEAETFIADLDALWDEVEPLYNELHTFIKNKLKERYGDKLDIEDGLVPAHVFGNMWAQSWNGLYDFVKPYPEESAVDVTNELVSQGYTPLKMFETANEFYKSMGLLPNDISYDVSKGAMIEKPTDGREVLCHASAWDFCDGQNYRIKMCTSVNYDDFITIHHEMGHIQYYLQYKNLPVTLRTGANPGFHEAIGDTIALSVATPKHLEKIGLLKDYKDSEEASINALMDMALERVAFLPFGLLIDKWRWDVFSGNVSENQWNEHWWQYRQRYQKIKPAVSRSDSNDFDPGAKYHVAGDSQYISYFVAHILEFQFYRSLCIAAGEYDPNDVDSEPLHKCDFFNSTEAGTLLASGLSLGGSKHWSDVLEVMTGTRQLSANAILEYFDPLYEYLKKENGAGMIGYTISLVIACVVGLLIL